MAAKKYSVRCPKCGLKVTAKDEFEVEHIAENGCSKCREEEEEEDEDEEEEEPLEDYEEELFDDYEDYEEDEYD